MGSQKKTTQWSFFVKRNWDENGWEQNKGRRKPDRRSATPSCRVAVWGRAVDGGTAAGACDEVEVRARSHAKFAPPL